MPYAEPTSPIPSPVKEHPSSFRRGPITPTIEDGHFWTSSASGPMPGIPRRSSSNHSSGANTPRRGMSPSVSRTTSSTHQIGSGSSIHFPISKPMEGLPRRSSQGVNGSAISGLPSADIGSLGLKLNGASPSKAPSMSRGIKDSISSTSTIESSLPGTPKDEPSHYDVHIHDTKESASSVPFPTFEPSLKPPSRSAPRGTLSPGRPPMVSSRRSSGLSNGHHGHHRGGQAQTGSLQIELPSSQSTPHLPPTVAGTPQYLRPTASMIRKKSGEVVKPSLKQRSMSTPDLTRQADSEPSSPDRGSGTTLADEPAKSVRFAGGDDGDGGGLEHVVLFLREQKVTAVSKAADPEGDGLVTETETENDTDGSEFVQFRTRRNAAALAADEAEKLSFGDGGSRVPRVRVDFGPDARGSLDKEYVVLERVELQSNGPLMLKGTVIVRNTAFQKWVAVRFTLDHWQTVSEVSGSHVGHIPSATTGDEGWDRFSFSIKLEDYKRKIEERQLLMCVRFSVDGREWWDSNDGLNYNFTFKKSASKRPVRVSGPPSFGGGFMRLNDTETTAPLPGLRVHRGQSQAAQINRAFGVTGKSSGPGGWIFPRLRNGPGSRPDSPLQTPPPPAAFRAPAPPDVHAHLQLKKYCAPSPPQSPPREQSFEIPSHRVAPLVLNAPRDSVDSLPSTLEKKPSMSVMGGNYATLIPPPPAKSHERRKSWTGGEKNEWASFSDTLPIAPDDGVPQSHVMGTESDSTPRGSTDGDQTPVAAGSRSPEMRLDSDSSSASSPDHRPLTLKRSTGNLQALITGSDDPGLMTPPSSTLSSPPSPKPPRLPGALSPSQSTSTGESSPVNTVTSGSTPDLANLAIEIDPDERGRSGYLSLSDKTTYQQFLDKFCFFQSPTMTPLEEPPVFSRPSYIALSGQTSPNGFPFYGSGESNSPRNTPTPTRQFNSSHDAFNFYQPQNQHQIIGGGERMGAQGYPNLTPRVSPAKTPPNGFSNGAKGTGGHVEQVGNGGKGGLDLLSHFKPGYKPTPEDNQAWTRQLNGDGSPSLAAAH